MVLRGDIMQGLGRKFYSCVAVLPRGFDGVDDVLGMWRGGVKMWVVTNCADIFARFENSFHMEVYFVPKARLKLGMDYDGKLSRSTHKLLKKLDKLTAFNYAQFMLEHDASGHDILVTAGAGTGKTTSMIARISRLIHLHSLTPHSLSEAVIMITFTNNAASHMKEKLTAYFNSYFELTRDPAALGFALHTEKMPISTIHAFARRLLNVEVVDTTSIKKQLMVQALQKYEKEEYTSHFLQIFDYLEHMGIDLENPKPCFGVPSDDVFHLMMLDVLKTAYTGLHKHLHTNRQAGLSNLIAQALQSDILFPKKPPSYVFIDEFQDTDHAQIALIKKLQDYLHFKLFVVGDAKQSIYRFRGAAPDAFEQINSSKSSRYSLHKNYRSSNELLKALNIKFVGLYAQKLLSYKRHDRLRGVYSSGVHQPIVLLDEQPETALPSLVSDCQAQGDIGILVRKNHQAEHVRNILKSAGASCPENVHILTIHKAKGLEFNTVILPFAQNLQKPTPLRGETKIIAHAMRIGYEISINSKKFTNNHFASLEQIDAIARQKEEARIFYVACTRAKNKLIILN